MRLSTIERKTIKDTTHKVFGENAQVFLFGSRVDDTKKGGDIDLFIVTDNKTDLFQKKILFLAKLKQALGEQKIDLVFNEDNTRLIEQEIQKWAIPI
jgi:predicted nucleotidyltransferase